jgi:hypothetical protein
LFAHERTIYTETWQLFGESGEEKALQRAGLFSDYDWADLDMNIPEYTRMVVGEGFEPSKALASRFTVCPRWPLEYPTMEKVCGIVPSDISTGKKIFSH